MKLIRRFIEDFRDLPKHEFFGKYFLLPAALFFLWGFAGQLVEQEYRKEDLLQVTGVIKEMDYLKKPLLQERDLVLLLEHYPQAFRISHAFHQTTLQVTPKPGDTVTIYYRKPSQVLLGFGRQHDIYQLEFHNQVVFGLEQRRKNSKSILIISGLASLLCFTFFTARQIRIRRAYR